MTQTVKLIDMTTPMSLILPVLAFVAGLATAQFVLNGDGFDGPQTETADHPRRGARNMVLTTESGTSLDAVVATERRGARLTDISTTSPTDLGLDAVDTSHAARARIVARD